MPDTTRTPALPSAQPIPFDARTRRVLELKRQIREGTYRPDSRTIARAILSHWFAVGLELERENEAPSAAEPGPAARFVVPKSAPEPSHGDSLTG